MRDNATRVNAARRLSAPWHISAIAAGLIALPLGLAGCVSGTDAAFSLADSSSGSTVAPTAAAPESASTATATGAQANAANGTTPTTAAATAQGPATSAAPDALALAGQGAANPALLAAENAVRADPTQATAGANSADGAVPVPVPSSAQKIADAAQASAFPPAPAAAATAAAAPADGDGAASSASASTAEETAGKAGDAKTETAGAAAAATDGNPESGGDGAPSEDELAAIADAGDDIPPADAVEVDTQPKSMLARLFASNKAGAPSPRQQPVVISQAPVRSTASIAATRAPNTRIISDGSAGAPSEGGDALPGVRVTSLFEIQSRTSLDDDSGPVVQLASAAGLARMSPGFLQKQRETVDVACLKPQLLGILRQIEYHFGKPIIVTSGYRDPSHNRHVGGAHRSKHMTCEAADIQLENVDKFTLASYVRSLPGRGGVGTYCYTDSVHVDVGSARDWNWRCRRRK